MKHAVLYDLDQNLIQGRFYNEKNPMINSLKL